MNRWINLSVGFIMILGMLCLGYLSVSFGEVRIWGADRYTVDAVFTNVTGLQEDTQVLISGIPVGSVESIKLDDYQARVTLSLRQDIDLYEDAIASIRTQGLLGEKYVALSPGGFGQVLAKDGSGTIRETNPAIVLEDLIGQVVFGSGQSGESK